MKTQVKRLKRHQRKKQAVLLSRSCKKKSIPQDRACTIYMFTKYTDQDQILHWAGEIINDKQKTQETVKFKETLTAGKTSRGL